MSTITNGASYRCIWWWTKHFADEEENVRTEIVQSRGLVSDDIHDLLCEMQTLAEAARPDDARWKNFMSIFDISPHPDKQPTEQQWDRMRQIIEEERGLKGEVYFMIEQEKADGRIHRHLVELRIDLETGRAIPDNWDAPKCHAASRRICEEFGWERTISPFDKDREGPRPDRAPKRWESYQAMQSGLTIADITAEVTDLRQQSDNGRDFHAALERHGYILALGDKKTAGELTLMIIDPAGDQHSLARRLKGVTTKELNEFMRDVDRAALPDIRQAQAMQQDRKIAALEADRDTVKHEIEWEEKLAQAAIEKEKIEERFIAPEDRERETRGGGREKEPAQQAEAKSMPAPELGKIQGEIRLARRLSPGPQSFANAIEDRGFILAQVTPADIEKEMARLREEWEERRRNPQTWMEHQGGFAALTPEFQDSARRSFDAWEERQEQKRQDQTGNKTAITPELSADDIQKRLESYVTYVQGKFAEGPKSQLERATGGLAVITPFGNICTLTPRNTGLDRDELPHYLQKIDRATMLSVTDAQAVMQEVQDHRREEWLHNRREEARDERLERQPLGRMAGEIRLARRLSPGPQSFANAIEDRGFILARVTPDDIQKDQARLREEWEERRRNPQSWMEYEGGFAALTPELQDVARLSFDKQQADRQQKKKETYLDSVQNKWAERLKQDEQAKQSALETYVDSVQKKRATAPASELECAAGGLAVVTPFGSAYALTPHNTGLKRDELPHYLKGIDSAALPSVTDAQAVMQEVRENHREEWLARQPLGRTAGEIRLAYSLTKTGQEFANAIEDRGSILAGMTDADAERLNRWERQRLKEEWTAPAPEKTARAKSKERTPEDKYRAGELVVVNQYGRVFQLTKHNTGHDDKARAERLKEIPRATLLSVTAAQGVMREFQQHRQEERRQAWQQQREEWLQPAREERWPVNAPQPERKSPGLFHQAATEAARDERTENLTGTAARVFALWRTSIHEYQPGRILALETKLTGKPDAVLQAETMKARRDAAWQRGEGLRIKPDRDLFAAALNDRGISFAVASKEEAERSNSKEAAFIRAVGNYAPRYKEGEIVLVTEPRLEYRQNGEIIEPRRVYKLDQSLAEKFVKTLDNRSQLKSIEATLKASDERAQKRAAEWEAIRLENATNIKSRAGMAAADMKKGIHKSAYVAGNVLDGLGKGFHALSGAFDSLISPKLSPEQIYEGEKAAITREAEAQRQIDWSNYKADRAQERQNNQEQQAARDRQRENERER